MPLYISILSRGRDATVGPRAGLNVVGLVVVDGRQVMREFGHDQTSADIVHFAVDTPRLHRSAHIPQPAAVDVTNQYGWYACEFGVVRRNRGVDGYLERRLHRPWRNRGS
jgi:hypothetical protein